MAIGQLNKLMGQVRSVALRQDAKETPDAELLRMYLATGDEAAFEALVRRHGRMVLGVCRRVLHNLHDANDAFQATFLVLIRKAGTLRSPEMLSNWLYGVAYRSALQAKKAEAMRRAKEGRVTGHLPPAEEQDWDNLLAHLDKELSLLSDKFRAVLVACDLDGRSRKEVARLLGLPEGTVASRLARARVMLARRMARHGPALSGGTLAMVLSRNLVTAAPSTLVRSTVEAAAAGTVPAKIAALVEGVLKTMLLTKIKLASGIVVAVALLASAAGVAGRAERDHHAEASKLPDHGKIDQLIRQLASKAFAQRAAASQALEAIGEPALESLRKAATVTDEIEQRRRIDNLIRRIEGRWQLHCFTDFADAVPAVAMTGGPDGWLALSAGRSHSSVRVWDVNKRKELRRFEKHDSWVWSVALSRDGKRALSGGVDGLRLWEVASGKELRHFTGHQRQVYKVALSADGRRALSGSQDQTVRLWDVDSGAELQCFRGHTDEVSAVAFSPDGKRALSAAVDNTVRLWDVESGKELQRFTGTWVSGFSPDGRRLLTVGRDHFVRLWDIDTGKELRRFEGHTEEVCCVAFSPNGKRGLSGSRDNTVRLWDLNTGKELRCFRGHGDCVSGVVFSPDGTQALSGSYDQTMRLWKLPK